MLHNDGDALRDSKVFAEVPEGEEGLHGHPWDRDEHDVDVKWLRLILR